MKRSLTEGSVFGNLLVFSLPFLLAYFMQTLYGLADLYIIGNYCDVASTTAVSIGSQVMHMVTVMIVGLAMGSTVLIGKAVGAKNEEDTNIAIGNTATVFLIISLVTSFLLIINTINIVKLVATPIEANAGTRAYLLICFAGVPFITAYNIIASIFRGMGDSKSPMYFIAVACVCNIALDLLFIGGLNMGPAGAALGTTLSQTISVIVSVIAIVKKKMIMGIQLWHFKPDSTAIKEIFKVGIPVTAQDGFIQVSFILITIFANMRGIEDAAAVGIVEKLIGILFLIPSSLLAAVSALCAQNNGANEHKRARHTLYDAALLAASIGMIFAIVFQFIAADAVALFTTDAEVIARGSLYMKSYVWDCVVAGIQFVFSGFFCAYSHAGISFMHNVVSIITARIPLAYYASVHYMDTLYPMGMAAPIGSFISVVICVVAFIVLRKKGDLGTI